MFIPFWKGRVHKNWYFWFYFKKREREKGWAYFLNFVHWLLLKKLNKKKKICICISEYNIKFCIKMFITTTFLYICFMLIVAAAKAQSAKFYYCRICNKLWSQNWRTIKHLDYYLYIFLIFSIINIENSSITIVKWNKITQYIDIQIYRYS